MRNRAHSKISQLPNEVREAVDDLLVSGVTYEQITANLREMGHKISRAAVGRYGKDFHSRLEKLKLVRAQARAVTAQTEGEGLELEEASSQILLQYLMEFLLDAEVKDDSGELNTDLVAALPKFMSAVAKIQKSGVAREAFKSDMRKRIQSAAQSVVDDIKTEGLSDEAVERIRRKILGVAA